MLPFSAFDPATGCYLKHQTFTFGGRDLHIKSLRDKQQFHDPGGEAEALGISPSMWPIAGLIWPSGHALATLLTTLAIDNLRILEIGCGIGLATLVARGRGANICATDRHPIVGPLLARNAAANDLEPIDYTRADWLHPVGPKQGFDLIICSDVLYESGHPRVLSGFIDHHARPDASVLMMAPQRRMRGRFIRSMDDLGFDTTRQAASPTVFEGSVYKGMLLTSGRTLE